MILFACIIFDDYAVFEHSQHANALFFRSKMAHLLKLAQNYTIPTIMNASFLGYSDLLL